MMMRSALYQTNTLAGFLQYQLTETTVCGYTCRSTLIHYPDSEPTSLCSFSLMQHTQRRSNKYQFCSLWFDPIRTRTHDLPHSRQARNHYTTNAVIEVMIFANKMSININVDVLIVHSFQWTYIYIVCIWKCLCLLIFAALCF